MEWLLDCLMSILSLDSASFSIIAIGCSSEIPLNNTAIYDVIKWNESNAGPGPKMSFRCDYIEDT